MRLIYLLFLISLFLISKELLGQEYSYTRYDIKEGLAGSVVYCMTQDKDGFLWFGTETGLSRFDGTRFTNFTSLDGLPDNEILNVFGDSKGRVWIAPFRAAICYYYKGRIHTQENDSMLKNIKLSSFVLNICEDSEGNVLLLEKVGLHLIQKDDITKTIRSINGRNDPSDFIQIGPREGGGFWVREKLKMYEWVNGVFKLYNLSFIGGQHPKYITISKKMVIRKEDPTIWAPITVLYDFKSGIKYKEAFFHSLNRYVILNDSLVANCTRVGAYIINKNQLGSSKLYLKNISVNFVMYDREMNLWLCTEGNGVYKLNSEGIKNITLKLKETSTSNVGIFSIVQHKRSILLGSAHETLYILDFSGSELNVTHFRSPIAQGLSTIVDINTKIPGFILFGTGERIFRITSDYKFTNKFFYSSVKKIHLKEEGKLLVATSMNVLVVDPIDFKVLDTIWKERATCVYAQKDTIYIGTLNGVYKMLPNRVIEYMGDNLPLLKNRITSISEASDGTLWMSTYGNGVIAYKNKQVTVHLTIDSGLTSNICKTLFLKDNHLWIGTDKGVNKVLINDTSYPIIKYTTADGLASDNINVIYQNDSMVFVGSAAGLTFFNEKYIASQSLCELRMTNLRVSNQELSSDSTGFVLPHSENNIRFDYVGISYRSVGDIVYRYRLLGLDTAWQNTRETFLSYPTLPSGEYELQIQATNKFNVKSQVLTVKFAISELLWEKTWFRILLSIITLALIGVMLRYLNSRVRMREVEKTRISSRISELEQLALKSQMNPHFIFNSLNSIQQYVMDKDIAGANRFISGFSKLIRQTLDFSSRPLVQLTDEIGYLRTYLELEKNRLEDKFTFEVSIGEELKDMDYLVPPMILQPYLENSLRHGIRFRKDNEGRIIVRVNKIENRLVCVIEDNGVGRKLAAQYKSINPIEYQSKGMRLTADRLDLINRNIKNKIEVRIDDIELENGAPAGTRVTVSFPEEYV